MEQIYTLLLFDETHGEARPVGRKVMRKMISPAILSQDDCQLQCSQYGMSRPVWGDGYGGIMSLLSLLKRHTQEPPAEVIQAACDLYGLSLKSIDSIRAEQLSALSPFLWAVTLNERAGAVVVYVPGTGEQPVAAPWFEETDESSWQRYRLAHLDPSD